VAARLRATLFRRRPRSPVPLRPGTANTGQYLGALCLRIKSGRRRDRDLAAPKDCGRLFPLRRYLPGRARFLLLSRRSACFFSGDGGRLMRRADRDPLATASTTDRSTSGAVGPVAAVAYGAPLAAHPPSGARVDAHAISVHSSRVPVPVLTRTGIAAARAPRRRVAGGAADVDDERRGDEHYREPARVWSAPPAPRPARRPERRSSTTRRRPSTTPFETPVAGDHVDRRAAVRPSCSTNLRTPPIRSRRTRVCRTQKNIVSAKEQMRASQHDRRDIAGSEAGIRRP